MSNHIYKAGAYIRLSREDGNKFEESNSIKNQRELIKQYIDEQDDISIYEYYADDGKTGTNFDRPGFQKLIKDMNDRKIDCIIVKDLSRFGRNYIEVGRYLDYIFPTMNIRFIAITDNVDNVKNPESVNNVIVPFKNLINDEYCRDISRKIKKVMEVKRLNGEKTGGNAPYGYIVNDKKYVIDEEVVDILRMIFDLCISGESTSKIAAKLNEQKIDSPYVHILKLKGKEPSEEYYWSSSKINTILKNRVYCGDLMQGKTRTLSNKVKVSVPVPKEDWIISKNAHEAIIDKDTFEKANLALQSRATAKGTKKNSFPTIFKGHLKCYDCKKTMVKNSCAILKNGICITYQCITYRRMSKKLCPSHQIKNDELVNLVSSKINEDIEKLVNFENQKLYKLNDDEELKKVREEMSKKSCKLDEIIKLSRNILYDLKKNLITKDDYDFYSKNYEEQITELNKELNNLKDKEFILTNEERTIREFIKKFKGYRNFKTLTETIINDLVETIYIKVDKTIEIKYLDQDVYDLIMKKDLEG